MELCSAHMNESEWSDFLAMVTQDALGLGAITEEKMLLIDSFKKNPANLPQCQQLLRTPGVENAVLCFAADSIYQMTEIACPSIWSGAFCLEFITWCLSSMKELIGHVPDVILRDLSRCIAKISIDFQMGYEFKSLFEGVGKLLEEGIPGARIAVIIYDEFIAEMNRRVKRGLEAVHVENLLRSLKNDVLPLIFGTAMTIVQKFRETNDDNVTQLCKESLVLCRECLSFSEKPKVMGDWKKVDAPVALKELLSDESVISVFFDVYRMRPMNEILKCIDAIACLTKKSFLGNSQVVIFGAILIAIKEIITGNVGLDDETNRLWITTICKVFSQRLKWRLIEQMPFFGDFLNVYAGYTQNILGTLTSAVQNDTIIQNLLGFWVGLSMIAKTITYEPLRIVIWELSATVCNSYISFLDGLVTHSLETSKEVLGQPKVSCFIIYMRDLIFRNLRNLGPAILAQVQKRRSELAAAISSGQEEATQVAESNLALLVQLMTDLVGKGRKLQDREIMMFHPQFLAALVEITRETEEWTGVAPIFMLEQSVMLFVGAFSATVFGTEGAVCLTLFQEFAKLGTHFGALASPGAMKAFLFKRILVTLRLESPSEDVVNLAVVALGKLKPPRSALEELVANHGESALPFLASPDFASLRRIFYQSLMSTLLQEDEANLVLVKPFLESFSPCFAPNQDMIGIWKLAIDMRGILTAVTREKYYRMVFDWLFPERSMLFVQAMENGANNPQLSGSLLKMWRSIVEASSCGVQRVNFPPYSANGVILFKQTAALLAPYMEFLGTTPLSVGADIHTAKYQGFRRCCEIIGYLVTLDCIPFDAFEIYNDPVFHDLLKMLVSLIRTFDFGNMFQYPKVSKAMLTLMRDVCQRHAPQLVQADPSFVPSLIQMGVLAVESSQKNIQSTGKEMLEHLGSFFSDPDNSEITGLIQSNAPEALGVLSQFCQV